MVEDHSRLEDIRRVRQRRLAILKHRAAAQGFNTPPEITIEIERIQRDLEMAETVITAPISQEVVEAAGPGGQYVALDRKLDRIVDLLSERMDRMEEHSHEWRFSEREARIEGQQGHRLVSRVTLAVSVAALAVAMVALGLVIFISVRVF